MFIFSFIPELVDYLQVYEVDTLIIRIVLVALVWLAVMCAMVIDFHHGTKKAKEFGEYITSEGYRRSVSKFKDYFSSLAYAFLGDVIISPLSNALPGNVLPLLPYFTIFVGSALILTEWKSVREKAPEKLRRRTDESFNQIVGILKDKEFVDRILSEIEKNTQNKSESSKDLNN